MSADRARIIEHNGGLAMFVEASDDASYRSVHADHSQWTMVLPHRIELWTPLTNAVVYLQETVVVTAT
jgi:hypothetical protein